MHGCHAGLALRHRPSLLYARLPLSMQGFCHESHATLTVLGGDIVHRPLRLVVLGPLPLRLVRRPVAHLCARKHTRWTTFLSTAQQACAAPHLPEQLVPFCNAKADAVPGAGVERAQDPAFAAWTGLHSGCKRRRQIDRKMVDATDLVGKEELRVLGGGPLGLGDGLQQVVVAQPERVQPLRAQPRLVVPLRRFEATTVLGLLQDRQPHAAVL